MSIISINCVLTEYYRPIYEQYFYPSVSKFSLPLNVHKYDDVYGAGFMRPDFVKVLVFKLKKILESIECFDNNYVVWSDVDIFFIYPVVILEKLNELTEKDIYFQSEYNSHGVNTGFMLVKRNQLNYSFFNQILDEVVKFGTNEQIVVNNNLHKISFDRLPVCFSSTTLNFDPKSSILIHPNCTLPSTLERFGIIINHHCYVQRKMDFLKIFLKRQKFFKLFI